MLEPRNRILNFAGIVLENLYINIIRCYKCIQVKYIDKWDGCAAHFGNTTDTLILSQCCLIS